MKCACPSCGRRTEIEPDVGDFPTRCRKCGALLRRPSESPSEKPGEISRARALKSNLVAPNPRAPQGTLAGILTARPGGEPRTQIAKIPSTAPDAAATSRILRPESLREVARVQHRQKALRRAQLRGNLQALGALGTVGFTIVALLGVSVLALSVNFFWNHPHSSRADVLRISGDQPGDSSANR